jgi:hypothetical protein
VIAAAIAALVGFAVIAIFQAALALGAPVGRAAWGGTRARPAIRLRIASAFAVGIWAFAALIILGRAGFRESPAHASFARYGTYGIIAVLGLSAIGNVASRSRWERFLWAPLSLALAVLCLVVARSGTQAPWG